MTRESVFSMKRKLIPYLFLAPALSWLTIVAFYPIGTAVILSLQDWALTDVTSPKPFIGLENYRKLLTDPEVAHSLRITIFFVGLAVSLELILGICLALLLDAPIKGSRFFSTLLLTPLSISLIAAAITWRFFFNPEFGTINYLITLFNLGQGQNWLGRPSAALYGVIAVDIWQTTPFVMLLVLAGLKSLPVEALEAAVIDGASAVQSFIYVKLPLLKGVILVCLLFRIIDALRAFDIVYVLTLGGPAGATSLLSMYIYKVGFKFFDMSRATALSVLFLFISMAIGGVIIHPLLKHK